MNEPARTDGGRTAGGAASAAGTVVSAVAAVGVAVPLRRGAADPAVSAAAAFALLALGAFLARRHGGLDRRPAGAVAAAASVGVVLASGYALNLGTAGAVSVPLAGSVPLVFVAFLAGIGAAGLGVAAHAGVSNAALWRRTALAAELAVVGVAGLYATEAATRIVAVVVAIPAIVAAVSLPTEAWFAVSQVGKVVGTLGLVAGYLLLRGYDRSFIDLRAPDWRDVKWGVAGLLALFGAVVGIEVLMTAFGAESSQHGTSQVADENPELLLFSIPAAILVIGPFEELLYRNVIQKSLYDVFSRPGAVVVASVIFAGVHLNAYSTAAFGAVLASLATVFGLSLALGFVYERTENLVVPAVVHGLYNAIVFANLYYYHA